MQVSQLYLLDGCLSLKENSSAEEFCEDAADGPDVDAGCVVLGAHEDFGRPVVLGDHLLRHVHALVRLLHPRQAKVTDLKVHIVCSHYTRARPKLKIWNYT